MTDQQDSGSGPDWTVGIPAKAEPSKVTPDTPSIGSSPIAHNIPKEVLKSKSGYRCRMCNILFWDPYALDYHWAIHHAPFCPQNGDDSSTVANCDETKGEEGGEAGEKRSGEVCTDSKIENTDRPTTSDIVPNHSGGFNHFIPNSKNEELVATTTNPNVCRISDFDCHTADRVEFNQNMYTSGVLLLRPAKSGEASCMPSGKEDSIHGGGLTIIEKLSNQCMCPVCGCICSSREDLNNHQKVYHPTVHKPKREVSCTISIESPIVQSPKCNTAGTMEAYLSEETISSVPVDEGNGAEQECFSAGDSQSCSGEALENHHKTPSREVHHLTSGCDNEACSEDASHTHDDECVDMETEQPSQFLCRLCNHTYKTREALDSHQKLSHPPLPLLNSLLQYPTNIDSPVEQLLECTTPDAMEVADEDVEGNQEISRGLVDTIPSKRPYQCDICKIVFTTKEALGKHQKIQHSVAKGVTMYVCPVCDRKRCPLETMRNYTDHQSTLYILKKNDQHSNDSDLVTCRKEPQALCTLDKNEATRTDQTNQDVAPHNERQNVDDVCEASEDVPECSGTGASHDTCRDPVQLQTPTQSLICEICGCAFPSTESLEHHQRICHLRVSLQRKVEKSSPLYTCSVCELHFGTSDSLETHKKTVHTSDDFPLVCEMCDNRCVDAAALKDHKKLSHPRVHLLLMNKVSLDITTESDPNPNKSKPMGNPGDSQSTMIEEESLKAKQKDACDREKDSSAMLMEPDDAPSHLGRKARLDHSKNLHKLVSPISCTHKCEMCSVACYTKEALEDHKLIYHPNVHHFQNRYECPTCGLHCYSRTILDNHIEQFHHLDSHSQDQVSVDTSGKYDSECTSTASEGEQQTTMIKEETTSMEENEKDVANDRVHRLGNGKELHVCPMCRLNCYTRKGLEAHKRIFHSALSLSEDGASHLILQKRDNNAMPSAYDITYRHPVNSVAAVHRRCICEICGCNCSNTTQLQDHQRVFHPRTHLSKQGSGLFICSQCGLNCYTRTGLETHRKIFHASERLDHVCEMCDYSCPNAEALKAHKRRLHPLAYRLIRSLDELSSQKVSRKRGQDGQTVDGSDNHQLIVDPGKDCQEFNKGKTQSTEGPSGMRETSTQTPFACEICGLECRTTDELVDHQKTVHRLVFPLKNRQNEEPLYQVCRKCRQIVLYKRFNEHQIIFHQELNHSRMRDVISSSKASGAELSNSKRAINKRGNAHLPVCPRCKFVCLTAEELKQHLKTTHAKGKAFKRRARDRKSSTRVGGFLGKFGHADSLQEETIEIVCPICGFSCSSRVALQNHQKTFHQLACRPKNVCEACNSVYPTGKALEDHQRLFHLKDYVPALPPRNHCDSRLEHRKMQSSQALTEVQNAVPERGISSQTSGSSSKDWVSRANGYRTPTETLQEETTKIVCPICDCSCSSRVALQNHQKTFHPLARRPNNLCEACNSVFPTGKALEDHQKIFHPKDHVPALPPRNHCESRLEHRKMQSSQALTEVQNAVPKRGISSQTSGSSSKSWVSRANGYRTPTETLQEETTKIVCTICGCSCSSRVSLQNHQKIFHLLACRSKNLCQACNSVFPTGKALEDHQKIFHLKDHVSALPPRNHHDYRLEQRKMQSSHTLTEVQNVVPDRKIYSGSSSEDWVSRANGYRTPTETVLLNIFIHPYLVPDLVPQSNISKIHVMLPDPNQLVDDIRTKLHHASSPSALSTDPKCSKTKFNADKFSDADIHQLCNSVAYLLYLNCHGPRSKDRMKHKESLKNCHDNSLENCHKELKDMPLSSAIRNVNYRTRNSASTPLCQSLPQGFRNPYNGIVPLEEFCTSSPYPSTSNTVTGGHVSLRSCSRTQESTSSSPYPSTSATVNGGHPSLMCHSRTQESTSSSPYPGTSATVNGGHPSLRSCSRTPESTTSSPYSSASATVNGGHPLLRSRPRTQESTSSLPYSSASATVNGGCVSPLRSRFYQLFMQYKRMALSAVLLDIEEKRRKVVEERCKEATEAATAAITALGMGQQMYANASVGQDLTSKPTMAFPLDMMKSLVSKVPSWLLVFITKIWEARQWAADHGCDARRSDTFRPVWRGRSARDRCTPGNKEGKRRKRKSTNQHSGSVKPKKTCNRGETKRSLERFKAKMDEPRIRPCSVRLTDLRKTVHKHYLSHEREPMTDDSDDEHESSVSSSESPVDGSISSDATEILDMSSWNDQERCLRDCDDTTDLDQSSCNVKKEFECLSEGGKWFNDSSSSSREDSRPSQEIRKCDVKQKLRGLILSRISPQTLRFQDLSF